MRQEKIQVPFLRDFLDFILDGLLVLVSWLSKELEHVLLVDFDTWLVERIDAEKIGGEGTGTEEEVDHVSEVVGIHLVDGQDDGRSVSFRMGLQGCLIGFFVDVGKLLSGKVVEVVQVLIVGWDDDVIAWVVDLDDGLEEAGAAFLDVLAHGMEVGREDDAGAEKGLVILAFGFIEELFEPFGYHAVLHVIGDEHFGSISLDAVEIESQATIEIGRVLVEVFDGIFLFTILDTL